MFLTSAPNRATIDDLLTNFFSSYRTEIVNLHKKQWSIEEYRGYTTEGRDIMQYYYALYFVILIWLEVREGLQTDWSYYETKYDVNKKRKEFACCNIDLDDILTIFGLPITTGYGVNWAQEEETLIIEPSEFPIDQVPIQVDILHLLAYPSESISYIN